MLDNQEARASLMISRIDALFDEYNATNSEVEILAANLVMRLANNFANIVTAQQIGVVLDRAKDEAMEKIFKEIIDKARSEILAAGKKEECVRSVRVA